MSDDRFGSVEDLLDRVERGLTKFVIGRCPRALVGEGFDGVVVVTVIGLIEEIA